MEELDGGIVAGCPMGFLENSKKTSHTVSYSCSISAMSFCRLDPLESLLINGRQKLGITKLKNPKALVDYSQRIDDVYQNLEDYNATKKRRVFILMI